MRIMVSACLLGENCKYNGGNNLNEQLVAALKKHEVVPVCPEVLGGLETPRTPCEIVGGIVTDRNGVNRDVEFRSGAQAALIIAMERNVELIVLQSRSPSCGVGRVYDGTFSGTITNGNGVFAGMALEAGIKVVDVCDFLSALNN